MSKKSPVSHTWIKSRYFPRVMGKQSRNNHAVIAVGGNVGDVVRRFDKLIHAFARRKGIRVTQTSYIMKNRAVGYENQEDFHNSVVCINTPLSPFALLQALLRIERQFGRKRTFENAPRTLDLDIIFYENRIINTKKLTVPHPLWHQRDFVYLPLLGLGNCK